MTSFRSGPPDGAERDRLAAGLGALVRRERAARGWSLAELRRRSGVNAGPWERGTGRPSWRSLCRVAVGLFPFDRAAAEAFVLRAAELAGPSLAGRPDLPATVSRELAVSVLVRSARVLGFELDDDLVRAVVAEQLRLAVGEQPKLKPARPVGGPVRAEAVLGLEGGRP